MGALSGETLSRDGTVRYRCGCSPVAENHRAQLAQPLANGHVRSATSPRQAECAADILLMSSEMCVELEPDEVLPDPRLDDESNSVPGEEEDAKEEEALRCDLPPVGGSDLLTTSR